VVTLHPFREADLPIVDPWFDDLDTQRWLGDREWPRRVLSLVDAPNRLAFLAWMSSTVVALVDVEHLEQTSFALVVAREFRRRGNVAARRLLSGLGFRCVDEGPDGFGVFVFP
jgi:hypothetical protein